MLASEAFRPKVLVELVGRKHALADMLRSKKKVTGRVISLCVYTLRKGSCLLNLCLQSVQECGNNSGYGTVL